MKTVLVLNSGYLYLQGEQEPETPCLSSEKHLYLEEAGCMGAVSQATCFWTYIPQPTHVKGFPEREVT